MVQERRQPDGRQLSSAAILAACVPSDLAMTTGCVPGAVAAARCNAARNVCPDERLGPDVPQHVRPPLGSEPVPQEPAPSQAWTGPAAKHRLPRGSTCRAPMRTAREACRRSWSCVWCASEGRMGGAVHSWGSVSCPDGDAIERIHFVEMGEVREACVIVTCESGRHRWFGLGVVAGCRYPVGGRDAGVC